MDQEAQEEIRRLHSKIEAVEGNTSYWRDQAGKYRRYMIENKKKYRAAVVVAVTTGAAAIMLLIALLIVLSRGM